MGAREKLNSAYLTGAVITASIVGLIGQSWTAFFVAAAILIGLSWHAGDIRASRRKK